MASVKADGLLSEEYSLKGGKGQTEAGVLYGSAK